MTSPPGPANVAGDPYRPLYLVIDRATSSAWCGDELLPLGVLLIVLGLLRIVPTVVGGMPYDVELAVAIVMLGAGAVIALGLRRRAVRWRTRGVWR